MVVSGSLLKVGSVAYNHPEGNILNGIEVVYTAKMGELYATDPTFYGNQQQPLILDVFFGPSGQIRFFHVFHPKIWWNKVSGLSDENLPLAIPKASMGLVYFLTFTI